MRVHGVRRRGVGGVSTNLEGDATMNPRNLMDEQEGADLVEQIARQLGIDEETARQGVSQLAPAVARGMQRNAGQSGGLGALLEALAGGATAMDSTQSGLDGNDVL